MRVFAAILAVILGSSAALAQSDPRANPAPAAEAAPTAKPEAKAKTPKSEPEKDQARAKTARKAEARLKPRLRRRRGQCQGNLRKANAASRAQARDHRQRRGGRARRQAIGPARHLRRDPAGRSHGDPERPDLGRRLHRPDRRRIQRAAGRGREGLPEAPQESGHRRHEPGGARGARCRGRAAEAGGRLAAGRGPGDRRAPRAARQARDRRRTALQNGTRWASAQGQLQVETFRIDTGATLDAVFEQQKKDAAPAQSRATSLQADSFVISGMQGLKKMLRARLRARTARCAASPCSTTRRWKAPWTRWWRRCRAPSCRSPRASPWPARPTRRAARSNTAPACSSPPRATSLTDRKLIDSCNVIALPGSATPSASPPMTRRRAGAAARLWRAQPEAGRHARRRAPSGADVTLVGIADPQAQGGGAAISTVNARLGVEASTRPLETAPALGFAGAAALDAQGRFAGMVAMKAPVVAGPAAAAARRGAGRAVRNFLERRTTSRRPARRRRSREGLGDAGDLRAEVVVHPGARARLAGCARFVACPGYGWFGLRRSRPGMTGITCS